MTRIFLLASIVAGLTVVACDRTDRPFGSYGHPANAPTSTSPTTTTPEERARAAEEARPMAPAPVEAPPVTSENTREDKVDVTVDQLKVKRDQAYDAVYAQYIAATGEKKDKDVPATFKSHCKSAGKGDKVFATDKVQAFFAQADVKQKCADVVRIEQQIDAAKDRK